MDIQPIAFDAFRRRAYSKNIHYVFGPAEDLDEFAKIKVLGGNAGQSSWMIQQCYRKVGVQMQVNREVSGDLMGTDFGNQAKVDNVPWVAPAVEVYFEDPLLPTVLLMKASPSDIMGWLPGLSTEHWPDHREFLTVLMQQGGMFLSLQLKPEMYDDFLLSGNTLKMETGLLGAELDDQDNASLAFMVNLVLKVFAFSSIAQYKPVAVSRKQMHWGGKSGVCGRPERPSVRTQYLPVVIRPKLATPTGEGTREFYGRRGHLHWYKSARFVHRQGTWDFMQPIVDPHTGKYPERSLLKVRKP